MRLTSPDEILYPLLHCGSNKFRSRYDVQVRIDHRTVREQFALQIEQVIEMTVWNAVSAAEFFIDTIDQYGKFMFLEWVTFTWDKEMDLVWPVNKLSKLSVRLATHHGFYADMSGAPALVWGTRDSESSPGLCCVPHRLRVRWR